MTCPSTQLLHVLHEGGISSASTTAFMAKEGERASSLLLLKGVISAWSDALMKAVSIPGACVGLGIDNIDSNKGGNGGGIHKLLAIATCLSPPSKQIFKRVRIADASADELLRQTECEKRAA
eukprot:CAMPEP_0172631124 /NCGR_PEP_ID=MMETSP1068-20121228/177360_1 /TAXON_ID=35684 /ORGANISM="Pseudopedinella elastica, Strain CCMP716" /LENGTH=121 /DNA_ID=CAMNT_0013442169 /DNA_START=68 /DNA_END=430 /DNA_ORIENTATION=+